MKKILLATAFIIMMAFGANAQGRDSFFNTWDNDGGNNRDITDLSVPYHNLDTQASGDGEAPLGSGLLVLTALGAGYAVYRKRNK